MTNDFLNIVLSIYSVGALITFLFLFMTRKNTKVSDYPLKEALLNTASTVFWPIFLLMVVYFFAMEAKKYYGK